ncbi:MAG: hypothetical protein FD176_2087 [Rhodospirillaceae bacterium]|nr:MAG: hypothetical protein FD176_2087 [Rhodospirillaceae bacterium]TNC96861.1 MAG: hypothetical protein FD119_1367 [Stygiobacter sp.]
MSNTVASISFNSNHSLSMDVEKVARIHITAPLQVDDGIWFCELLVRTDNGTVVLNLMSADPASLQVVPQGLE